MPAYKAKPTFPGVTKLPSPVRSLVEAVYPQEPDISTMGPAAPLVARGGPAAIKGLKAWGKQLVEHARSEFKDRPDIVEALAFAQQRLPRLFGHFTNIKRMPTSKAESLRKGRPPIMSTTHESPKYSNLTINPEPELFHKNWIDEYPELYSPPASVGHELLHVADNLTMPDAVERYNFSQRLPGGYDANSYEFRAKNAGESLYNKFMKHKAAAAHKKATGRIITE